MAWRVDCPSEEHTRALGRALGESAEPGAVVALVGALGAGKTSFSQGVGEGLGVRTGVVSPTFVLMAEHEGRLPLLHVDVYRLERRELANVGLEEALEGWPGVALVEWGDRFPEVLPADHLRAEIRFEGDGRAITVEAAGPRAADALARWRRAWDAR